MQDVLSYLIVYGFAGKDGCRTSCCLKTTGCWYLKARDNGIFFLLSFTGCVAKLPDHKSSFWSSSLEINVPFEPLLSLI